MYEKEETDIDKFDKLQKLFVNSINLQDLIKLMPDSLKTYSKLLKLDEIKYFDFKNTLNNKELYKLKEIKDINFDLYLRNKKHDSTLKFDYRTVFINYLKTESIENQEIYNYRYNNITEINFVNLLRYQTHPEDYINFYYLTTYFDLKFDKNQMIIFTDEFPLNNKIRKESLIIYWIIRFIKNHNFFKYYADNHLWFMFKKKLELNIFPDINTKCDLLFNNINLLIEINELNYQTDMIKKSFFKLNKKNLISIELSTIYNKEPNLVQNINTEFLNSKVLKKYLYEIESYMLDALMLFTDSQNLYLKLICFDNMSSSIYKQYKEIVECKILIIKNNSNNDQKEKLIKLQNRYNSELQILNNFKKSKTIENMVMLKQNFKYVNYGIEFNDLLELFEIKDTYINIEAFKNYLKYVGDVINTSNIYTPVSWSHLYKVIILYTNNDNIKQLLEYYYRQINYNYGIILNKIIKYKDSISVSSTDFKDYYKFINQEKNKLITKINIRTMNRTIV